MIYNEKNIYSKNKKIFLKYKNFLNIINYNTIKYFTLFLNTPKKTSYYCYCF